jgi:DNA-binding transcriptional regulator YiaG
MRNTKIVTEYTENRFGFPVLIHNVTMVEIRGEWLPKINYVKLANDVLKALALKPSRLTGNELRFIRLRFEMTLYKFAERFDVSHPAVIKWENTKDAPTKMNWSTEKDIRLFIYNKLLNQENLSDIYNKLEKKPDSKTIQNTQLDIKEEVCV